MYPSDATERRDPATPGPADQAHGARHTGPAAGSGPVLVVDFGAQYAQLIARRVRECQVYSEIVPSTATTEDILQRNPAAIILSGGPASVYAAGAPPAPAGLLEAGVPVLGICYGFQLMVRDLGGEVARTGSGEYGAAALRRRRGRARGVCCSAGLPEAQRGLDVARRHLHARA